MKTLKKKRRAKLPGADVALVVHRYDLQSELVDALKKTRGSWHMAARVENCHREFTHHKCKAAGHHFALPAQSCGVRICPFESRRRSMRMVHRIKNFIDRRRRRRYRYIVFSEARCKSLNEGILSVWRAWNNLRVDPFWSALVRGAVVVLEITYTKEAGKLPWHPHINVLCEGSYIPDDELRAAWLRATEGRGLTAHIEAADLSTIPELVKYVTKLEPKKDGIDPETGEPYPPTLLDSPDALDEFLKATRRRRFIRTYGTFYRMPKDEDAHVKCPDCGCLEVVKLERLFPWQVGIDARGHFRLTSTYLGENMNGAGAGADRGG